MAIKSLGNKTEGHILTVFIAIALLFTILILIAMPYYKKYQNNISISQAYNLGKELAFEESLFKQRNGNYTDKFSELLIDFPCPLQNEEFVCHDFSYQFNLPESIIVKQKSSNNYFQINISQGEALCNEETPSKNDFCKVINEKFEYKIDD